MENINYSLIEYFQNKYPNKYDTNGECIDEEVLCKSDEYNKLITDLWKLFTPYNLKLIDNDEEFYGDRGEKNSVTSPTTFKKYVYDEDFMDCNGVSCVPLYFNGFANITPEIFLEDIKDILEQYSVKPTKAGEPTKGLNSVASVFMKYIEIKTPPHIIKLRKTHQDTIDIFRERENKLNWELKQYKELKELQDMKGLVEKNKSLMEENIKLVEKEDVRKKVQQWLENNSEKINFKIGKELYDMVM